MGLGHDGDWYADDAVDGVTTDAALAALAPPARIPTPGIVARRGCRRVAGSGMGVLARTRLCELVQLRKVDHDRIGVRTGDNPDGRTVGGRVDFLVHGVRRNENEVSRPGLDDVLEAVAPPVPGGAFKHVQDCLLIAVVVR